MRVGSGLLLGCVVSILLGGADAVARPIPGLSTSESVSDTFEGIGADEQPVDPVILEPIRPLLPTDGPAAAILVRPAPCGAMGLVTFSMMFVSLGFMGGTRCRARSL